MNSSESAQSAIHGSRVVCATSWGQRRAREGDNAATPKYPLHPDALFQHPVRPGRIWVAVAVGKAQQCSVPGYQSKILRPAVYRNSIGRKADLYAACHGGFDFIKELQRVPIQRLSIRPARCRIAYLAKCNAAAVVFAQYTASVARAKIGSHDPQTCRHI